MYIIILLSTVQPNSTVATVTNVVYKPIDFQLTPRAAQQQLLIIDCCEPHDQVYDTYQ